MGTIKISRDGGDGSTCIQNVIQISLAEMWFGSVIVTAIGEYGLEMNIYTSSTPLAAGG